MNEANANYAEVFYNKVAHGKVRGKGSYQDTGVSVQRNRKIIRREKRKGTRDQSTRSMTRRDIVLRHEGNVSLDSDGN